MTCRYLNGSHRPAGNSSPKTSDSTACRGCPPPRPRDRRRSQRPRPALHCSLGPSPTPQKRDALRISNDFNFCLGPSVGSSPEPLTPHDRELPGPSASDPITGPSPLLRAGPPLCPASVLSHSQPPLLVVLPLAAKNTGRLYRSDRFSCSMPAPATSSRHPYTRHRRGHIQPTPRLRTHRGEPLSQDHTSLQDTRGCRKLGRGR